MRVREQKPVHLCVQKHRTDSFVCGRVPVGSNDQGGPDEIKVMITNHCSNCDEVAGHFDINAAPGGWDNPKIYWKQLDPSECQ